MDTTLHRWISKLFGFTARKSMIFKLRNFGFWIAARLFHFFLFTTPLLKVHGGAFEFCAGCWHFQAKVRKTLAQRWNLAKNLFGSAMTSIPIRNFNSTLLLNPVSFKNATLEDWGDYLSVIRRLHSQYIAKEAPRFLQKFPLIQSSMAFACLLWFTSYSCSLLNLISPAVRWTSSLKCRKNVQRRSRAS